MSTPTPTPPTPAAPTPAGAATPSTRRNWKGGLAFIGAALVVLLLVVSGFALTRGSGTPATADTPTPTASAENTTEVVSVPGYELHFYSKDKGVTAGYLGPGCVPVSKAGDPSAEDTARCKSDLIERVKHDPLLSSQVAEALNLLPGVTPGMTAAQVEQVRKDYASKMEADVQLRKQMADNIAVVLGTVQNLHMVRLSGLYHTTTTDGNGNIVPIVANMDPTTKFALTGTTPDGRTITIKTDCGYQVSTPVPPPGPGPVPPGPTPKPTPKPKPPCPSGKCDPNGPPVMTDSKVPAWGRGPNPTGKKPQPGKGNADPGANGCTGDCPAAQPRPKPPVPPDAPAPGGGAPAPQVPDGTEQKPPPPPPAG